MPKDARSLPSGAKWFQRYENKQIPVRITEQSLPQLIYPHFHDFSAEFMLVKCGKVNCTIGSLSLILEAGDVVFIPPDTFHRADAEEEGSRIIGMTFDLELLSSQFGDVLSRLLLGGIGDELFLWSGGSKLALAFAEELHYTFCEYTEKRIGYEWSLVSSVLRLSALVLREVESRSADRMARLERGMIKLNPALLYIDAHYGEKLQIPFLAELVGLSADHFTKEFRFAMGVPPVRYINRFRIRKSLPHLLEGRLSIRQVAELVGFEDESYFNRLFHRQMGLSPMNYRKGIATTPDAIRCSHAEAERERNLK